MNFIRGHDRGGGPQEGVSEVQQELQDVVKKYESLERDSKTQAYELAKACQSA